MSAMKLNRIRSAFATIAAMPINENQAHMFSLIDSYWKEYDGKDLGEYRQVIEDQRELAASKIRRGGFEFLI